MCVLVNSSFPIISLISNLNWSDRHPARKLADSFTEFQVLDLKAFTLSQEFLGNANHANSCCRSIKCLRCRLHDLKKKNSLYDHMIIKGNVHDMRLT